MKASPQIHLWVTEEKNKRKEFTKLLSGLKRPDLEDLCLCLLMEREYDGYNGRKGNQGTFIKYDVQVEETIKFISNPTNNAS
jgi:hypothetical protein